MFDSQKVLSIIIVIILSVLLTYISYFPYKWTDLWNGIAINKNLWFKNISLSKTWSIEESSLSWMDKITWSWVFLEKISTLDEIYFNYKDSYKKIINWNDIKIELKDGIFAININDLSKNYSIYYDWFLVKPVSLWKVFINTKEKKKPLIFSLDSVFQLNLINDKSEILTKTYLYPHQYIKLDFTKNLWIRNIDSLRILTSFINWYVKDPLFKDNKIIEQLSAIFPSWDKENMIFLNTLYKNISININNSNLEYEKYSSDMKDFNYIIEENKSNDFSKNLSINNKKESVNYKNIILLKLKPLFDDKKVNENEINYLLEELNNLKNIDLNEYENTLNIIYNYNKSVILSNNSSIESKDNFNKLLLKIWWKSENYNKSYLTIKDLYSNYDYWNISNFDDSFSIFLDEYIWEYNLSTLNNPSIWNNLDYIDSFLLFFSKVIKSKLLSNYDNISIDWAINMLNKYFLISNNYYFNTYSKLPKHIANTWLYQNVQIIYMVDWFISKNFFEEKQNDNGLVFSKNIKFNSEYVSKLSTNIKNILSSIYDKKTDFLLEEDYNKLNEKFDKYFQAIVN